ncbi:MAG TPA: DUF2905 family protein [Verrucomicrobiae bacterium]|nr:DUF2905 family protein [Verrucomicrobiae bacterium]
MTIQKVGYVLIQLGGVAVIAGFLMVKFPQLFGLFGKLPGDINIDNKVFVLVGTSIVLSILFSAVSLFISFLVRFLK